MLHCMGCHGSAAQGVPGKIPPLAHSLGRFLRTPEGRNYVMRVPGAASSALSDERLAEVLNWLLAEFNHGEVPGGTAPFSAAEVARYRRTPLESVSATRRAIVASLESTGAAPPAQY